MTISKIELYSDIDVRLQQHMGGDHMVVAAAWVSSQEDEELRRILEADPDDLVGTINYLMKHKHGSPFEHGGMTFFVHAPIFVFREWFRHRIGWSYNEESGRYKRLEPLFWIPRRHRPMEKAPGYKPSRPIFQELKDSGKYLSSIVRSKIVYNMAYQAYLEDIEDGIGLEVARRHLPLATYSSAWTTCNPRSLMHFLGLRTHEPDATFTSYPQAEIEEAARQCEAIFAELWPITYQAWVNNGRVAP